MNLPESAQKIINQIKTDLPTLIPEVLLGIYIHGSIAYGNFVESRSDIDITVVIKRPLNADELQKLREWYASPTMQASEWINRLEMDYPVLATLITDGTTEQYTTLFQDGVFDDMDESDGSTPLTWLSIKDCGITLWGPPPSEFVPDIPEQNILNALKKKFDMFAQYYDTWMREDTHEQVGIIVTLCRITYYLSEKKNASKVAATKWCLTHVPEVHQHLLTYALDHIDNTLVPLSEEVIATLPAYVDYVGSLFRPQGILGNK